MGASRRIALTHLEPVYLPGVSSRESQRCQIDQSNVGAGRMTDGEIVIVSVSEGGAGFVKATNQWSGLSDPLNLTTKARRNSVSK